MAESSSVQKTPPCTDPIGLYRCSPTSRPKMTWPFSTPTMLIPRSEAIGAAGARPSAIARKYSSPLRSRASAAPTRGSVQVTVRCRTDPASSRLSSPMEPSLAAPGIFRPGGGEGRLGGMVRVLVGRDAECAVLSRALAAAPGRGVPVVLVCGEGGVGKTTLVEHVLARAGTPVLSGRAAAWAGAAYDVLARALRPAVRDMAGPVPTVLAQIFPERGVPPATPDPAALAAGVCSVLGRLAPGRPLALFLDDLQWADQATLGLLPALADAAGDIPVVLIGCYRSDELPRDHRLRAVRAQLRRSRQLAEVDVSPLDDEDVARMLAHLLGTKPGPALAAAVASRAEGIPFAVEELALALRDGGASAAVVPDGIREAVLLRTARLSGQERTLLETAAVASQEFDIAPVLT